MSESKPFLYSTSIPAHQSRAEITHLLAQFHATSITQDYSQGKITGMSFELAQKGLGVYRYALPVRTDKLYAKLSSEVKRPRADTFGQLAIQAEKIAWRQLLVWLKAQLALVDLDMAASDEVFLPYMSNQNGQSFYQAFKMNEQKMLSAGKGETGATK